MIEFEPIAKALPNDQAGTTPLFKATLILIPPSRMDVDTFPIVDKAALFRTTLEAKVLLFVKIILQFPAIVNVAPVGIFFGKGIYKSNLVVVE